MGQHFSEKEKSVVETIAPLPLWTRLDFDEEPIELQPTIILRSYI
jgi:hypothetical protein